MMPPHFFHSLETIFEYPEEEQKKTKEYEDDVIVDRIRSMTPSKSLKEEKQLMKKNRKSLGKGEKSIESKNKENVNMKGTIDENNALINWIPRVLERLNEKVKKNESKHHEKQAKMHWEKVLKEWN